MVGEGIEVTDLPYIQMVENKENEKCLVTRPESRGNVASSFARMAKFKKNNGLVTAITGPPGILKSWTLIYALQQALLYEDACVIFFLQKQELAYLFIRREKLIYAWIANQQRPASLFYMLKCSLSLLDPPEAAKGGANLPAPAKGAILYAASNNEKHFNKADSKACAGVERYLGPSRVDQLKLILKHTTCDVSVDEAIERTKDVNNLLRYIIDERSYKDRINKIGRSLRCLTDEHMKTILAAEGMSFAKDKGEIFSTVPGTLFMVGPRPLDESHNGDAQGASAGSGNVLPSDHYDGGHLEYEERVLTVATNKVYDEVIELNRGNIWSFWGVVHCDESAKMGRRIEELFSNDLKKGVTVKTRRMKIRAKDDPSPDDEKTLNANTFHKPDSEEAAWSLLGTIFTSTDKAAAMPANFPVIDSAGPGRLVYQVTVGEDQYKKSIWDAEAPQRGRIANVRFGKDKHR